MRTKKLLFYLLAVLLGGCVPVMSLHPLYTEKDIIFEKKLLGTWVDDPNNPETTWEFKRFDEQEEAAEKAYKLIFSDNEGRKGSFVAHLIKLDNKLFLDIYPGELPWDPEDPNKVEWLYNTIFLIPAHTFIKIDSLDPQLKMGLTVEDKMEELLKENPGAVKHTSVEDRPILTGSTQELQAFVAKYADDSRLFANEIILTRKKDKTLTIPVTLTPAKKAEEK